MISDVSGNCLQRLSVQSCQNRGRSHIAMPISANLSHMVRTKKRGQVSSEDSVTMVTIERANFETSRFATRMVLRSVPLGIHLVGGPHKHGEIGTLGKRYFATSLSTSLIAQSMMLVSMVLPASISACLTLDLSSRVHACHDDSS